MDDESEGTQKLFYLSGPVIDTLRKGKLLVIDEIEARMHTLLTQKLIGCSIQKKLIQSCSINFCYSRHQFIIQHNFSDEINLVC